ncbi:hypothetical protein RSAG8_04333, partial [Rhizoctonia solani AG-8 WAC10335]
MTEHAFTVCGSLLDETYSYPFDLEQLAIPELEDSESEREPDLVPTTDPESSKSTILETPSPQLEPDTDSNLARFRNCYPSPRTNPELPRLSSPPKQNRTICAKFCSLILPNRPNLKLEPHAVKQGNQRWNGANFCARSDAMVWPRKGHLCSDKVLCNFLIMLTPLMRKFSVRLRLYHILFIISLVLL